MEKQGFTFNELVILADLLSKQINFSVLSSKDDTLVDADLALQSQYNYDCISGLIEILRLLYSHRPLPF